MSKQEIGNKKPASKIITKNRANKLSDRRALIILTFGIIVLTLILAYSLSESRKNQSNNDINKNSQLQSGSYDSLNDSKIPDENSLGYKSEVTSDSEEETNSNASGGESKLDEDLTSKAVITAVGDIILHKTVLSGALIPNGKYDFNPDFEYVAPIFKSSDYTIANYEGALNGPPYSGYPMFGGPDEIITALKTAGVDMVTTANNHAYDRGLAGLKRTAAVFKKEGIEVVGTTSNAEEAKFKIVKINGISIGITGYTYETIGTETDKALNGMILSKEAFDLVDSFNPSRPALFEKDKQEMAIRIQEMKDSGAQCIIFILHWGAEYKTASNSMQKDLAQYLSDQGVDIIFGHHPHVLQEISVIKSQKTGKETLVYYSLGNFLANMSYNTHNTNGNAEDAVIAKVTIERDKQGIIKIVKGDYIKTYVFKNKMPGVASHVILPVESAILNPSRYGDLNVSSLLKASSIRIDKVFANNQKISKFIGVENCNE